MTEGLIQRDYSEVAATGLRRENLKQRIDNQILATETRLEKLRQLKRLLDGNNELGEFFDLLSDIGI